MAPALLKKGPELDSDVMCTMPPGSLVAVIEFKHPESWATHWDDEKVRVHCIPWSHDGDQSHRGWASLKSMEGVQLLEATDISVFQHHEEQEERKAAAMKHVAAVKNDVYKGGRTNNDRAVLSLLEDYEPPKTKLVAAKETADAEQQAKKGKHWWQNTQWICMMPVIVRAEPDVQSAKKATLQIGETFMVEDLRKDEVLMTEGKFLRMEKGWVATKVAATVMVAPVGTRDILPAKVVAGYSRSLFVMIVGELLEHCLAERMSFGQFSSTISGWWKPGHKGSRKALAAVNELWKEIDPENQGLDVIGFGRFLHNLNIVGDETAWEAVRALAFDAEFNG